MSHHEKDGKGNLTLTEVFERRAEMDSGKTTKEIENIYKSFERKRKTTEYLRMKPIF